MTLDKVVKTLPMIGRLFLASEKGLVVVGRCDQTTVLQECEEEDNIIAHERNCEHALLREEVGPWQRRRSVG
jgi:hypothetical protein